jgi:hypothetical protein
MINLAARPKGKRVQLMATCLCDAFYDDVAKATVEVLEHAGCEIEFPENQTCCGQPAFNCGQWPAARQVMRHTASVFAGDRPIIVPSGSCAAMMFHGSSLEFEHEPDRPERLEAPRFARAEPEEMLIDEVEAIWAAIDGDDDWAPFHDKIARLRAD